MKTTRTTDRVRLGCEIALSVMTVVLAIVFIAIIAQIYYGPHANGVIYSREIVRAKLMYAIAPVALWLLLVVACFVLSVLFPRADKKRAPTDAERVAKLRKRIPSRRRDTSDGKYVNEEHRKYAGYELARIIAYAAASAFAVAIAVYTIVYITNKSNFASGEINADIVVMLRKVLPFIAASFLLFIGVIIYERVIARAQLGRMKNLLVACKGMPISASPLVAHMERAKAALIKAEFGVTLGMRITVAVVAVVFIGLGIWDGGMGDVFGKAVALCTECIGLG